MKNDIQAEKKRQRQAAFERFQRSRDEYEVYQQRLQTESIEDIESIERLETRKLLLNVPDIMSLERILHENDLMPINYLSEGLKVARSVCQIQIHILPGQYVGDGTGVLVAPSIMLTNHHVLMNREQAGYSPVRFHYDELDNGDNVKPNATFQLDPDTFFYSHPELDFTLVAVQSVSKEGISLSQYGYLEMIEESGKALINEPATIIQHPYGGPKQIALRNNRILGMPDQSFIHYETDTASGSSGSPVLNDQWNLVALHHEAVPRRNSDDAPLMKNGSVWQPGMDDKKVDWIAGEGVRISAIVSHLRNKSDWQTDQQRHMIQGLLDTSSYRSAEVAMDSKLKDIDDLSPITLSEFYELVQDENTTEAELAPYLRLDKENSKAFAPAFTLHEERIIDIHTLEGDFAVNWLNRWSKSWRQRRYRRKISTGLPLIKIVSEGDSWFQYPLLLKDTIDHLMDDWDEFAIYSLGQAGDTLRNMLFQQEYMDAIQTEKPEFFLISAGGNDILGGGRLADILEPFRAGRQAREYLNRRFDVFERHMKENYQRLFRQLQREYPRLKVLCHGYDYVIPNNDKWLGQPMDRKGISEPGLQYEIMQVIIDRMNSEIAQVARTFSNVTYLDMRNTITSTGWFDELHPFSEKYKLVAEKFAYEIQRQSFMRDSG